MWKKFGEFVKANWTKFWQISLGTLGVGLIVVLFGGSWGGFFVVLGFAGWFISLIAKKNFEKSLPKE